MRSILLAVALLPGCKKKRDPKPTPLPVTVDAAMPVAVAVPVVPAPVPEPPAAPPVDAGIAVKEGELSPEVLARDAKAFVAGTMSDLVMTRATYSYVRSDGTLDPKYGMIEILFGNPSRPLEVIDDPSRPTGAPLPKPDPKRKPRERDCPHATWSEGAWTIAGVYCTKAEPIIGPRCAAKVIWERAIADKAPPDALAVISLWPNSSDLPRWSFRINDPLRKVAFARNYVDDCPLAVEK